MYKKHVDSKILSLFKRKKKISDKKIDNLIVSLTSFPERIGEIKYTIYSLLDQTILPQKIILWLAESQFPNKEQDLPAELLAFRKYGFNIKWCDDLKSYKKLIPALEQFPDHYIVTADDDIYYKRKWLEKMWKEHLKYPNNPVCNMAYRIIFKDRSILPYNQWEKCVEEGEKEHWILAIGAGGILHHKKYLYKDISKNELFMKLAPHADDIWFYFMVILNGNYYHILKNPYNRLRYVNPYREYGFNSEYKLALLNEDEDKNDLQFNTILNYYKLDLHSLNND